MNFLILITDARAYNFCERHKTLSGHESTFASRSRFMFRKYSSLKRFADVLTGISCTSINIYQYTRRVLSSFYLYTLNIRMSCLVKLVDFSSLRPESKVQNFSYYLFVVFVVAVDLSHIYLIGTNW